MVVECKAPGVRLGQTVADQVGWYNTALRARHVLVTNGSVLLGWGRNEEGAFRVMDRLPLFPAQDQG